MVLSEVVQSTGEFHETVRHRQVGEVFFSPQAQDIFDDVKAFDASDGVFVLHALTR